MPACKKEYECKYRPCTLINCSEYRTLFYPETNGKIKVMRLHTPDFGIAGFKGICPVPPQRAARRQGFAVCTNQPCPANELQEQGGMHTICVRFTRCPAVERIHYGIGRQHPFRP